MGDTLVTCTSVVLYKFQAVILDRCVALSIVVSPVGLEPTVYRLEVCCIIQLCYGNKKSLYFLSILGFLVYIIGRGFCVSSLPIPKVYYVIPKKLH